MRESTKRILVSAAAAVALTTLIPDETKDPVYYTVDSVPATKGDVYVKKLPGGRYCGLGNGRKQGLKSAWSEPYRETIRCVFPEGEYNVLWFIGFFISATGYRVIGKPCTSWFECSEQWKVRFVFPDATSSAQALKAMQFVCGLSREQIKLFNKTGELKGVSW